MKGGSPRTRGNAGWRKNSPDLAKLGALLRETGVIPTDADPIEGTAHWDKQGRLRLIKARYPDGWIVTMRPRLDGSYSIGFSTRLVTQPKGATA